MKRKLSRIEHVLSGNVVCFVNVDGHFAIDKLRGALARVQCKHPALRALIRPEVDGLYYEDDPSIEIPLRFAAGDHWPECEKELSTSFAYHEPQLRVVCLRRTCGADLLFATSHRICDGMSILLIVEEVLRALYLQEELIPYKAVTVDDIISDFHPAKPWTFKLLLTLLNSALKLVPSSNHAPPDREHFLAAIR